MNWLTRNASRLSRFSSARRDVDVELQDDELEAAVRADIGEEYDDYALITDYLAGDLSAADRERVEERLRTDPDFRELADPIEMIWNRAVPAERKEDYSDRVAAERGWQRLKKRLELEQRGIHTPTLEEKRAKWHRWRSWVVTTVGGIFTGALMLWLIPRIFPVPEPNIYLHLDAPPRAERAARLPDATEVALGPGSHLRYSRWLTSVDNTINLNGEATFTVPPGRRDALVIAGAGVVVKATGARFTVQAYDALPVAYVVVHEGRVQVQARTVYAGSAFELVKAGERVRVGPELRIMLVNDAPTASHQ